MYFSTKSDFLKIHVCSCTQTKEDPALSNRYAFKNKANTEKWALNYILTNMNSKQTEKVSNLNAIIAIKVFCSTNR